MSLKMPRTEKQEIEYQRQYGKRTVEMPIVVSKVPTDQDIADRKEQIRKRLKASADARRGSWHIRMIRSVRQWFADTEKATRPTVS